MNSAKPLLFLILLQAFAGVSGQERVFNSEMTGRKNFMEEIYLQTDRDLYITGEQVWMKILKFEKLTSSPENESKVVYLELLNNSGIIIRQVKVACDGFSSSAMMRLPDTLTTGNYLIRAYTSWMRNYGEDCFFYRYVSVINPFRNIERLVNVPNQRGADSVRFFPEGGKLVAGLNNRVEVRTRATGGAPLRLTGEIINSRGELVTSLTTDSSGFGIFTVNPVKDDRLYFRYRSPEGAFLKQQLPDIQAGGFIISVQPTQGNSSFKFRIKRSGDAAITMRQGRISIYSGKIPAVSREISLIYDTLVVFPGKEIPAGTSLALLSDNEGNLLSERWIFKSPGNGLVIRLSTPGNEYAERQKVIVDIEARNPNGGPAVADMSVSVVKRVLAGTRMNLNNREVYSAIPGEWLAGMDESHINDRLLELKKNGISKTGVHNTSDSVPEFMPELGGHLLSGTVRSKQSHEPLRNTDISLSFVGRVARCQFAKTDSSGKFNFVVNNAGMNEIVIQPMKSVTEGYYVEFEQPFCTTFSGHAPPHFSIDSTVADEINKAVISMQVSSIYASSGPGPDRRAQPGKLNDFFGVPDKTIRLSDYIELTTMKEVIKELVPDILVTKKNKDYVFKLINLTYSGGKSNPLVLVDGIPFYNLGKLLDVSSKEIERIDILNSRYFFTEYIFDGIVNVVTKKGNLSVTDYDNSVFRQVFEGCQVPTGFSSPDYRRSDAGSSRIPDFRNTLYWKPDIITGTDGKASVSFYTSDEPGDYVITVEGVMADGSTGSCSIPLTIK